MDVILPVKNRGQLCLRLAARPDKPGAQVLADLGLALPTSPRIIQNVVEKIKSPEFALQASKNCLCH